MKKTFFIIQKILILTPILLMMSCGSYINKIHNQLDAEEKKRRPRKQADTFALYRKSRVAANRVSTRNRKSLYPSIRRKYMSKNVAKKRYTSGDLTDNVNTESLWSGSGKENYLFTVNKSKTNGDIVLINVFSKLKNEITNELKRVYPQRKKRPTGEKGKKPASEKADNEETAAKDDPKKIHDRISSVIVEEINRDHLLVRGRKTVIYNGFKRAVEVQALLIRRDINDNDTIDSTKFLESSITILR
jgi:flagellar L-ring protein FlgH